MHGRPQWSSYLHTRFKNSILTVVLIVTLIWTGVNHVSLPPAAANQAVLQASTLGAAPMTMQQAAMLTAAKEINHASSGRPLRELALELVEKDPWALAKLGRQQYLDNIRDYTCIFLKQERIGKKLRGVEETVARKVVDQ